MWVAKGCLPVGAFRLVISVGSFALALEMRDMIGGILTDGGYLVLRDDGHCDAPTFGPPLSDHAWKADFVFVIYEGKEISHDALDRIRRAASGKIVLLLRENWIEDVSEEVLVVVDGVLNDEVSAAALLRALNVIQGGERVISQNLVQSFAKQGTAAPRRCRGTQRR